MKKLLALILVTVSLTAHADGHHHHGGGGDGKWLAPFLIGGTIGYLAAPKYAPPPAPVYVYPSPPQPVYTPQPTPYYIQVEEYDPACACFVRFYRRIN